MSGKSIIRRLSAKAEIAGDLFREGSIQRVECFRIGMDAALGEDTGPIKYMDNTEYRDGDM